MLRSPGTCEMERWSVHCTDLLCLFHPSIDWTGGQMKSGQEGMRMNKMCVIVGDAIKNGIRGMCE